MKKIFLAWKPSCTRSHNQSKHFGAKDIYIYPFSEKRSYLLLFLRYGVSFFITLKTLFREKADVVFTLNQPPLLIIAVFLYTRVFGGYFILDSHSAAFNDVKWKWFLPFYRLISSRALLNINTNEQHQNLVKSWGGRSVVISDVPIDHVEQYLPIDVSEKSIAVVSSFMFDEPIEEIWKAARMLPGVIFYVTGNYKKISSSIIRNTPSNIHLTGYISVRDYFSLLVSVKAIMVLTTRDNTMQMGAYEALSLEQPIITSDWAILQKSFGEGAVYTDNSAESIAKGVRQLLLDYKAYKNSIAYQRKTRREYFEKTKVEINSIISECSGK